MDKKCEMCGELMINVVHNKKYCDNCRKIKNREQDKKYYINKRQLYNEQDYINNFNNIVDKYNNAYVLTTKGFDLVSKISSRSYACFFKKNWYDILKNFNQLEKIYEYMKKEFIAYYKATNDNSVDNFLNKHQYLTRDAGRYFGHKTFKMDCGLLRRNYTLKDLEDNFMMIVNQLGRIPNITEFIKISKIHPRTYVEYYKLNNQIWDDIIRLFIKDENKIIEYHEQQKAYISKIASKNSQKEYVYDNEKLATEFKKIFDYYYNKYNSYPSRRLFNKVSKLNDVLYRKRFKKNWTEICKMYGYNITNDNHKSEKILLGMIKNILNMEFTPQKTWEWLIGINGGLMYCDGYFEDINLVIEFDGVQHRTPISKYGGQERFKIQIQNDNLKDTLLKEHNINLIRIDSRTKWYDENYLKQLLSRYINKAS